MTSRQPGQNAEQESLLTLDGVGREAGSGEVAVSSFNQGMEPGWPRIFHCGLSEEVELPLLAEPRLSAEQVGVATYFFITGGGGAERLNPNTCNCSF